MSEGKELERNLYVFFKEIAKREKEKSIEVSDYGKAFVLAILEGIFKEAASSVQVYK